MSKKYIFFKCTADPVSDFSKDQLAELELSVLNGGLRPVQTIFQLMDIPDLKLIISKSEPLQKLLTAGLSSDSVHGYLWSGEYLPEMYKKILFRSVLIDRCFIFQRNTDPVPDISDSPYGQLQQKTEIYNWWIFSWFSFYHIYTQAQRIRHQYESEIEIDKYLEQLLLSEKNFEETVGINNNRSILFTKKMEPQRWLHVLLNFCAAPVYLVNLSLIPGIFSALSGKQLCVIQSLSRLNPETQIAGNLSELDLQEFHTTIDSILSSVRLLLSSSVNSQTDLFMDPVGKDFISVWQLEKERLKTIPVSLSEQNQKAFAVTRFLIERGIAGSSEIVSLLLKTAFVYTLSQLLKKQGSHDFISLFQKSLRALYSDLYLIEKLRPLTGGLAEKWKYYENLNDASAENIRSIVFQPRDGYLPKKNKTELQLSRLFNPGEPEAPLDGFDEEQIWHDEIGMQGLQLRKTGRAGKYLFNRLYTQNLKKEATTLFWHWQQVESFLQNTTTVTPPEVKICLVLPTFQINEQSVSNREIVLEQFNDENALYPFKIVKEFTSGGAADLIIMVKKKDEQDA